MKVNETLRNKRIELGLSQTGVAKYLKIPQSSLCRYEQGVKMRNNELITHKLVNFYKEEYKNLQPVKQNYQHKLIQNVHKAKTKSNGLVAKFEKIYNEELKILSENIEQKAFKRTIKRMKKEM